MNTIGNISDSLKYPTKNWVKIVILGIILIIPIVNFIGLGYYLRIIKTSLNGLEELPDFMGIGELFFDGIKLLIVCIIYTIIPIIFYALSVSFARSETVSSSITTSSVFSSYLPALTGSSIVFFIIAIIFTVIISIFAYVGIASMAYQDSEIAAALKYHEILDIISVIGWGNYMLWWIIVTLIVTVAGSVLDIIGGILSYFVLGVFVLLLGYSYLLIFQSRSVALTFTAIGE